MVKIALPRIRSFEFHDLESFPSILKYQITNILYIYWIFELPKAITDYFPILKHLIRPRYQVVSQALSEAIASLALKFPSDKVSVMDMCSGGSGPNDIISKKVNQLLLGKVDKPVKFYLSDLYPNLPTWKRVCANNPYLHYISKSIDATKPFDFPQSDKIFQTFYCCFHHFDDGFAKKILKNSLECSDGFAIIETTNRTFINCFKSIFLNPLFIFLITPFYIKKVSFIMLSCIYFFPALVAIFCWDSFISCLRTRSNEEIVEVIKEFDTEGWYIETGSGYSTWGIDKVNWVICIKTGE